MKRHEAYPSRYTKAAEISGPVTATIENVDHDTMQDGTLKPVVHFDRFEKPVIVNRTNAELLYGMADSDDDADWPGLTVELYTAMVRSPKGGTVESICFRRPKRKTAPEAGAELDDEIPPF
jgi:hypothetical protein